MSERMSECMKIERGMRMKLGLKWMGMMEGVRAGGSLTKGKCVVTRKKERAMAMIFLLRRNRQSRRALMVQPLNSSKPKSQNKKLNLHLTQEERSATTRVMSMIHSIYQSKLTTARRDEREDVLGLLHLLITKGRDPRARATEGGRGETALRGLDRSRLFN